MNERHNRPLLNEAQERSLNTALRLLEERLFYIELLLENGPYQGILFTFEINLEAEQIKQLKNLIKTMKELISELKKKFDLSVKKSNLHFLLQSTAAYFWAVLEDEKAQKLKRYGAIAETLPALLDPVIEDLVSLIQKLDSNLKKP